MASTSGREGGGPTAEGAPPASRLTKMLSGSISGMAVSVVLQPLDVLRTTMQIEAAKTTSSQQMFLTLRNVLNEGGVSAMWRGSSATLIRLGLGAGFHFLFIDIAKSALEQPQPDGTMAVSPLAAAFTGGAARALSAAALCPITLVKTRLEYGHGVQMYAGPIRGLQEIYGREGARGLFRGLGPTVLTNAPFSGLYYMFYSQLKPTLSADGRNQTLVNFAAGTVAAGAATIITQPADVLRTRAQMGFSQQGVGMLSSLRSLILTQGPSALMIGTSPKIVKKILQTALVWTVYEELVPRLSQLTRTVMSVVSPAPKAGTGRST
mmetsp:Transcript_8824/g.25426  ORF Transcript_8824/g.25426 Transcript_8824/m.25426 type:complete len:322 (+) Transcript_8824:366-1331(+)